jgi:hypothetical protein
VKITQCFPEDVRSRRSKKEKRKELYSRDTTKCVGNEKKNGEKSLKKHNIAI